MPSGTNSSRADKMHLRQAIAANSAAAGKFAPVMFASDSSLKRDVLKTIFQASF